MGTPGDPSNFHTLFKPFQPPVGLRKTFGDEKNGYVTGYENAFKAPDLSKITPVKNCKPAHQYKPPVVEMECASTTHSQFTGKNFISK